MDQFAQVLRRINMRDVGIVGLDDAELLFLVQQYDATAVASGVTIQVGPLKDAAQFELTRRQTDRMIKWSTSLTWATWGLVVATLLVVCVTFYSTH